MEYRSHRLSMPLARERAKRTRDGANVTSALAPITTTGLPLHRTEGQNADQAAVAKRNLRKQLRVIQQNVQCLRNKTHNIECLLQSDLKCDVFLMTEHWLETDEIEVLNITNYNLVSHFCRQSRKHGGVCIYVHSSLNVLLRDDLCKFSIEMHIEIAAIQLIEINLIVICIYRSNTEGDFTVFLNQLEL